MNRLIGRLFAALPKQGHGLGACLPLLEHKHLIGPASRTEVEGAIRARCQLLPLDADRVVCRVLGRYKFLVDRADLGLSVHLMLDGYWEFWCTDFILRHLKPGQVAFDVGANLGYYAVLMAEAVGHAGHVHAVEPNPHLATMAEQNLALNGMTATTTLHRAAAFSRSGAELRFMAPPHDPKNGHVLAHDAAVAQGECAVASICLDDHADRPAHFLKIDVEGSEEQVWAGMQRLLDISPEVIVLMEFNAGRCADAAGLLTAIALRFPLRELNVQAQVVPCAKADLLRRQDDVPLLLTNRAKLEPLRLR